jgi:zinc protease
VANSFLGEHRTFNGRLMNELRGDRGLNYGDYSYIEYWNVPPFTSLPSPNVPRREQYFSVWIRPVVPVDAQFALRAGLYEVQRLRDQGLTQEEFELTRDFLVNYWTTGSASTWTASSTACRTTSTRSTRGSRR